MPIYYPHGHQGELSADLKLEEARKALRQTQRLQRSFPHNEDMRGKGAKINPIGFPGAIIAVVNSAIGACSGTTPGTGTADLYYMDGPDATSATADMDNQNKPVINWLVNSGTINSGHHIWVIQCGQFYGLLTGDC